MNLGNRIARYTYWLAWFFGLATYAYKAVAILSGFKYEIRNLHATNLVETSALLFVISIASRAYAEASSARG